MDGGYTHTIGCCVGGNPLTPKANYTSKEIETAENTVKPEADNANAPKIPYPEPVKVKVVKAEKKNPLKRRAK